MSFKLKALGLSILAVLAASAFVVVNAAAGTGGKFYTSAAHPTITVTEEGEHKLHLVTHNPAGEVGCTEADYTTTLTSSENAEVTVSPSFGECTTTSDGTAVTVTMNGCSYTFRVAAETTDETEQTADLECPIGKAVEVHHPSCTVTIPAQANVGNITFTKKTTLNKWYITIDVKAKFNTQNHGGICIFLGTPQTGTLNGSATIEAFNTNHEKIDLEAK